MQTLVDSGLLSNTLELATASGKPGSTETFKEDNIMSSLRKQDTLIHHSFTRSERVFVDNGLWYFRTREGGQVGPFRYESEARQMLQSFINDIQAKETEEAKSQKLHLRRNAIASIANQIMTPVGLGH